MKVLLVSPDPATRQVMELAVRGLERRLGERPTFLRASDGVEGLELARHEHPDAVVADEIASRAGAFSLARDLRGGVQPYLGAIVILLERKHDAWLADWSGADAWFLKPPDPFALAERLATILEGRTEKERV